VLQRVATYSRSAFDEPMAPSATRIIWHRARRGSFSRRADCSAQACDRRQGRGAPEL